MAPMLTTTETSDTEVPSTLMNGAPEAEPERPKKRDRKPPDKGEAAAISPPPAEPKSKLEEDGDAELEEDGNSKPRARGGNSAVLQKLKVATDMEVRDWLQALSAETAIKVIVTRREPKFFRDPQTGEDVKTDGMLTSYERQVTEEEIQQRFGGGTYLLRVNTRGASGRWEYFAAKTIEIAGDPKISAAHRERAPQREQAPVVIPDSSGATEITKLAFGMMREQVNAANNRQPAPTGLDPVLLQAVLAPLNNQISALNAQIIAKDQALAEARNAPKDPFQQQLLSSMLTGESARVESLRTNHESEIRQLREGFTQTEARLRDQHARDIDRLERAHERELAAIRAANEQALAMAKQSADVQKQVLDAENRRLSKELDDVKSDLKELRAKKDQSIGEKIKEMKDLKELVNGDEEEDEEDGGFGGTVTKIVQAVGSLPVIASMAERVGGGGQAAQQQQQPARPKLVRDKATGDRFIQTPQGLVPIKKKPVAAMTDGGHQVEIPAVDPEQVKQAVSFMEGAFKAGTDPATFVQSARPYVPTPMLEAIRALGITSFMVQVAKLEATSPLATMSGRNWLKKVARELIGDVDPEPAPATAPETPPIETE